MGTLYCGIAENNLFRGVKKKNLIKILMEWLFTRAAQKKSTAHLILKEVEATSENEQTHGEEQVPEQASQKPEEGKEREASPASSTKSDKRENSKIRRPVNFLKPPHSVWISAVASILLIAIGAFLFKHFTAPKPSAPQATAQTSTDRKPADPNLVTLDESQIQSIKLEAASLQPFLEEKVATGKIGFNEDALTPVFSPYIGRINRLFVKPGDKVMKGAPLFEIETTDLVQTESDLIAASIALAKAKSVVELARRAEDRQHILYANKAVALKDWEQAEADLRSSERDVHSQETALAAIRDRLRTFGKSDAEIASTENDRQIDRVTKIFSPISGTVTARKVGLGQYVKPDTPDPLFTIADLSSVWLLADVYEADIPLVKIGQLVQIHVNAFPNEVFTARVTYIGAALDPTTHRVAVRSVIENHHQKLKPDMFANFHIATQSQTKTLAVPTLAIVLDGDKTSVWVADKQNQFIKREVVAGLEQNGYRQILSGLQPGDRVVSEGSLLLTSIAMS